MTENAGIVLIPVAIQENLKAQWGVACNLARARGASIVICQYSLPGHGDRFIEELAGQQRQILASFIDECLGKKVEISSLGTLVEGSVEEILRQAEKVRADQIILPVRESTGRSRSLSYSLIAESEIPVVVVSGRNHRSRVENIILPLDLGKETRQKIGKAIRLSEEFGGAGVRVVHMVFTTDEFIVNRLSRELTLVRETFERSGVTCTAEIIRGVRDEDPLADNILEYAERMDGDLILIMPRQEKKKDRTFIGSAASAMIEHSSIPVMCFQPSDDQL